MSTAQRPWKKDPNGAPSAPSPAARPWAKPQTNGTHAPKAQTVPQAALAYAKLGWLVFPSPADGGKMGCISAENSNGNRWGSTRDHDEILDYYQRFLRANVGIATGPDSGIFVLEADTPDGHVDDGIASLKQLEEQHGELPATLMAESPSGSVHRYFKYPADCIIENSASKLAPGVDVRGFGGMVIAPPSVRPGKGAYRWINSLPIADAPEWLVTLASKAPAPQPKAITAHAGRSNATSYDDKRSLEQLEDMLFSISPDCDYDDWLKALMAVHCETGGSGQGLALVDRWSSGSCKGLYPGSDEMTKKWNSFNGTGVTGGTLATLAREYGADLSEIATRDAKSSAKPRTEQQEEAPGEESGATIIPIGEWISKFNSASDPLIEDISGEIIGRGQQGVLYGPTGTGKTAILNEFILAVATGTGLGRIPLTTVPIYRSVKGRVLSAVYEDPLDYRRRIFALAADRGVDLAILDCGMVPPHLDITRERDQTTLLNSVRAVAEKNGTPSLLSLDTTAAAIGGKSINDDDVVGCLFALSQKLVKEFLCTVIFVAHPGKGESRGIAGSYRFQGNSDFVLRTLATKDSFRLVKDKDRNGAKRPLFDYSLKYIEVEQTASGKPRTGAIVGSIISCSQESLPQHDGSKLKSKPKIKGAAKIALRALEEALLECGETAPASNHIPPGVKVVKEEMWRQYAYQRGISTSDEARARQTAFSRGSEWLISNTMVGVWDKYFWLINQ